MNDNFLKKKSEEKANSCEKIRINGKETKLEKDFRQDPAFEQLKKAIKDSTGFNCEQYKEAHFKRRINVRVRATNSKNYGEYLKLLKKGSEEYEHLIKTLTINVSEFFRNPETFTVIEKEVIPSLIESKLDSSVKSIRVWSAGCASGEEAYSLAILLHRILGKDFDNYRINILSTDIDDSSLEKAKKGIYSKDSLKNVNASVKESYFMEMGEIYQITNQLKNITRFKRHDIISEPCISRVDLIICRNVMIYFKKEIQEQLQLNFYQALNKGGFLIIGKAETLLGAASNCFKPHNVKERVYLKDT